MTAPACPPRERGCHRTTLLLLAALPSLLHPSMFCYRGRDFPALGGGARAAGAQEVVRAYCERWGLREPRMALDASRVALAEGGRQYGGTVATLPALLAVYRRDVELGSFCAARGIPCPALAVRGATFQLCHLGAGLCVFGNGATLEQAMLQYAQSTAQVREVMA